MGLTVADQLDRWEKIAPLTGDPLKGVSKECADVSAIGPEISESDDSDSDESNPLLDMGEDKSQSDDEQSQEEMQLS